MRVQSISTNYQSSNKKAPAFEGSAIFIEKKLTSTTDRAFYAATRLFETKCQNKGIKVTGFTNTTDSPIGILAMRCETKDDAPFILMAKEFAQRQGWEVHTEEGFKYTLFDLQEKADKLTGKKSPEIYI